MAKLRVRFPGSVRIDLKETCYWIIFVFLTLPHMKPQYLNNYPKIDLVFDILRAVSFGIILFWYIIKRRPVSIVIALTVLWRVLLLYSTIINNGEIYDCLVSSFSIICVMLLYDTTYNSNKITFVSAQLFCFELVIYINLLTEIIFPDGLYTTVATIVHTKNWFLGYYNNHSQYFIPALMFAWLYRTKTGKLFRPVLLAASILLSAFLVWSGGVLLSLICMILVFVFFKNRTSVFNYYTYWSLHIVFFVSVYVLHLHELFDWLLIDILNKLSSLTSRIDIWKYTLGLIREAPIFGYGIQSVYVRVAGLHTPHGVHAHNMFLELLYQGGLIGLVIWTAIVIMAGRKLIKYGYTKESKIISTAFLGWCIATLVEPFTTPFLMGMFVIAYRSNQSESKLMSTQDLPKCP